MEYDVSWRLFAHAAPCAYRGCVTWDLHDMQEACQSNFACSELRKDRTLSLVFTACPNHFCIGLSPCLLGVTEEAVSHSGNVIQVATGMWLEL